MSSLTLRLSEWPIVVTTLTNGAQDQDYEAYFADFEALVLGRNQRFASLVDASLLSTPPTARQRRLIADWQKSNLERGRELNIGIAMVFTQPVVRAALTALHWLMPPATPTVTMATYESAFAWCVEKLRREGVAVPAAFGR